MNSRSLIFEQDEDDKSIIKLLTPNNDLDWEIVSEKNCESEPNYWYFIYNNIKIKTLEKFNNLNLPNLDLPNLDLSNLDLPNLDLSNLDLSNSLLKIIYK
jgi:uncharacterized protein YjbI with pentapeptide repeats